MKVRKRLLWLALSLCVCLSLLSSSAAVSVSAATLPEGDTAQTKDVYLADILNATKSVYAETYYSSSGYLSEKVNVTWKDTRNISSDLVQTAVAYSVPGGQYRVKDITNIYNIPKLSEISGEAGLDWFFGTFLNIYIPTAYARDTFGSVSVMPVYTTIDGETSKADTIHAVVVEPQIVSMTVNGQSYYRYIYNFMGEGTYIGCAADWIPDGYFLSGFAFHISVTNSDGQNPGLDTLIPAGNYFCFSEIYGKGYPRSDATTNAINNQTEELKAEIKEAIAKILDSFGSLTNEIKDATEKQTEEHRGMFERLGDRISGFFDNLLSGILDGLKGLIIPDDGYFDQYFADWDAWMEDHFGALYYPFDLILDVLNRFLTLEVPETPSIVFPTLQVGETVLLEAQTYTFFGEGSLSALNGLYQTYRMVVTAIFVFALSNLAWRKLNSIMGGGE